MTSRAVTAGLVVLVVACAPGCSTIRSVAVGVGIVSATSDDTAQVDVNADRGSVYETAREILMAEGDLDLADADAGRLVADLDGSNVAVSLTPRGDVIRVRVTARKMPGRQPDLDLAERLARDLSRPYL
jgi:hypothetical protein